MFTHELDFNKGTYILGSFLYPKCPWCDKCKELLQEKGIQYMFIQADKKLFGKIMGATKSSSVPQVIMDGEFIGGYDELEAKLNGDTQ